MVLEIATSAMRSAIVATLTPGMKPDGTIWLNGMSAAVAANACDGPLDAQMRYPSVTTMKKMAVKSPLRDEAEMTHGRA